MIDVIAFLKNEEYGNYVLAAITQKEQQFKGTFQHIQLMRDIRTIISHLGDELKNELVKYFIEHLGGKHKIVQSYFTEHLRAESKIFIGYGFLENQDYVEVSQKRLTYP